MTPAAFTDAGTGNDARPLGQERRTSSGPRGAGKSAAAFAALALVAVKARDGRLAPIDRAAIDAVQEYRWPPAIAAAQAASALAEPGPASLLLAACAVATARRGS